MELKNKATSILAAFIGIALLPTSSVAKDQASSFASSRAKCISCWGIGKDFILKFDHVIFSDDAKPIRGFEVSSDGKEYHSVDAIAENYRIYLHYKHRADVRFVRYSALADRSDNLVDSNGPLNSFTIPISKDNCLVEEILKQAKGATERSPYPGYKHVKDADLYMHPNLTYLHDYDLAKLRYVTAHNGIFYKLSGKNTYTSKQLKGWKTNLNLTKKKSPVTKKETWATTQWVNDNHCFMLYLERATKNIQWGADGLFTAETAYEMHIANSYDGCKTWTSGRPFVKGFTSGASLCKLPSGRIIMACHQYSFIDKTSHILIKSTDDGVTWHRKANIEGKGTGTHAGISEANLIAVDDNTVLLFHRTGHGKIGMLKSIDSGETFQTIDCGLPGSSSALAVVRLPDNRLLIAYNSTLPKAVLLCDTDVQQSYNTWLLRQKSNRKQLYSMVPHNWFRSELSVRISDDNANSWSDPIVIAHRSFPISSPLIRCASPTLAVYGDNIFITSQEGLKASFQPNELFK